VSELLAGHQRPAQAKDSVPARDGDAVSVRGPELALPAGRRETRAFDSLSGGAGSGWAVAEFRESDRDYLEWIAAHPGGFVINIGRSGRGTAVLHRADCATITSSAPVTGACMKVCSGSPASLDEWALRQNGVVGQRCGFCRPPPSPSPAAEAGQGKELGAFRPAALPAHDQGTRELEADPRSWPRLGGCRPGSFHADCRVRMDLVALPARRSQPAEP
jgi:hypothetical protein